ncbi:MAG: nicotinamide-nucleotide amidase [Miltoncostaeaceae bacterium]|nr:nicotinamide-nucleotide amidase [Miltoncostaeaceae bacterium]
MERVTFVGDAMPDLVDALTGLLASGVDLLCVSGGLGPTHDDLTMAAVAAATGRPHELDEDALAMVRAAGTAAGVDPAVARSVQEKQATLPRGAHVLPPPGTAPGCVLAHGQALIVVLPGPPWELQAMWDEALASGPLADRLRAAAPFRERVLRVAGVPESRFVRAFDGMDPADRDALAVGVCARDGELEVTVRHGPAGSPAADALERALRAEVGDALYSRDGGDLDTAVARLLDRDGATLAVAESCTGGGLGARLTAREGASARFLGGVISYSDDVKRDVLGVDPEILRRHGAVSAECAEAMAGGVRRLVGSDWALSITGVAGPGGGSEEKPVGLVYLGIAGPDGVASERLRLRGDRERVRARSAALALHLLRRTLEARAPA